ncbi:MAG TPA: hypothetical protein DEF41_13215 [Desulfovibrio sp.]|uniref:Uncharacterized protein n=1 Tax=Nitratidesulfovibrio vulgaris (strain ATCC 29579 / DSM 644 / CCUG 34227 / NCIMB 8303 / VKM B-1760 / Hildenborough) TaxID=882 RepID=Q726I7_NITV2|nr:hypothetical protein DVU_3120 [Nitratidesulfovibrio vulgaris str. Hildenborough]HBW17045.1 hypothetical protein [Desulfovibrio sp.]
MVCGELSAQGMAGQERVKTCTIALFNRAAHGGGKKSRTQRSTCNMLK